MKRLLAICVPAVLVLNMCSLVQAKSIKSDSDYKASTDLSVGAWTTIRAGTDYEMTGYAIADEFQLNLLYQAGILDSDIDNINHYWQPMGWNYNFGDNEEYILNVSAAGGLTIYEYDGLQETIGGTEIKWTLTGWHQTILAGDIIDNGDGTITLVVLPAGTYRPFIGDPPVNDVEIFDGDLNCEVLGYKFTGAIDDISDGGVLSVILAPDTISVPEDFTTIQAAINAANKGDTIIVATGTYTENVNITKAITLEAASSPVIDGSLAGPCVTIAADGVTVDGFEIKNGTNGIVSWDTENSTIENCDIHDNLNVGGYNGVGIMFWTGTGNVDFDNNTIADNTIYNNDRQGIYIGWLSWPGPPTEYSNGNTISGNIIYNNGLCISSSVPDESEYGIQLCFADDNTIQDNEIYGHNDWWFGQGIYLFASYDNTVTGNNIHDNSYGINLWTNGYARTIGNNYINCNAIAGNGFGIWNIDGAAVTVDAECNWWGSADGPSGVGPGSGDAISSDVDYDPWLLAPTGPIITNVSPYMVPVNTDFAVNADVAGCCTSSVEYSINYLSMGGSMSDPEYDGTFTSEIISAGIDTVGVYDLCITAEDCCGNVSEQCIMLAVYDPSAGFVTGGGWIWSPAGAYTDNLELEGKANFGFVSKYKKGATVPTGNTEFVFKAGNLNFHSSSYDWLVVTGSNYARFKGSGTINDEGNYKFMLWAGDGEPDTFRIKIWEEDELGVETIIYDNGMDQAIGGGSIVVHTK